MTRLYALIAAVLLSALTVGSATLASTTGDYRFNIRPDRGGQVHVEFRRSDRGNHSWSSDFAVSELRGFQLEQLDSPQDVPVRFALVREAGRLDCGGTARRSSASGSCEFAVDEAFASYLAAKGVRRPNDEEAFGMVALNVRRQLVDALVGSRFPAPTPEELVALTALGVSPSYIADLGKAGYRPRTIDELTQFAALGISPDYVGDFVRAGYRDMSAEELVQMKALGISADYVRSFEQVGYGRPPVEALVQFKALGVTADFVRDAQASSDHRLTAEEITSLRAVGFVPRRRR